MREVELKSVVDDVQHRRNLVERAGASLVFEGRLLDVRYDQRQGGLVAQDHVLRLRVYEAAGHSEASIDWKSPTRYESGYKVRDELSSMVGDPAALAEILGRLGFVPIREIDREIAQYEFHGALVRFERYPRMDPLVEVEGTPDEIERAIKATGLPREGFTSERLPDFAARFEQRTGERAALSTGEVTGNYEYRSDDA